jgi:ABC-type transporter Mla MlaB component
VNASVDNGVVTLTGEISRDRLPRLMQAVNSLHPKKVNNKLTVK